MSETSAMDHPPNRDERLLEAIEACRPGSDDLADPAMARLVEQMGADPDLASRYRRVQQIDGELGIAFRKVSAPEGLQQRLLERLAAAQADQLPQQPQEPPVVRPAAKAGSPGRTRRRWLAAAGSLAVTAGLIAVVWAVVYDPQPLSEEVVLHNSLDFFKGEVDHAQGNLVSAVEPPPRYPLSTAVFKIRGTRWRQVSGFLDRPAVAYDLLGPNRLKATLYVVRRTVPGLPKTAPLRSARTTGGMAISAWQQGDLLYVLVVNRGDQGAYRHFLDVRRGPLT